MDQQIFLPMKDIEPIEIGPTGPFVMPDLRSSREERERALQRLNAVRLSVDQYERAIALYLESFQVEPVHAFCAAEGLMPTDVAVAAIFLRKDQIDDMAEGFDDLKQDCPERYRRYITDPIDPVTVGLLADGDMITELDEDDLPY